MSVTLSAPELMEHLEQTLTIPLDLVTCWIEDLDDAEQTARAFARVANMLAGNLDMELAVGPPEKNGDAWTFPLQPIGTRNPWSPYPMKRGWSKSWDWKDSESDDLW